MKLSIETKVAAAVAGCFAFLSICAIAQEQGQDANAGSMNSGALSQITLHASSGSSSGLRDGDTEVLGPY